MPKERPCVDATREWPSASLDVGLWRIQGCHQLDLELLAYGPVRKISLCCISKAICSTSFQLGREMLGRVVPCLRVPSLPGRDVLPKPQIAAPAASLPNRLQGRTLQAGSAHAQPL